MASIAQTSFAANASSIMAEHHGKWINLVCKSFTFLIVPIIKLCDGFRIVNGDNPNPRNIAIAFEVGDRVRIKPEWQDEGDDEFERIVVEAPGDCTRVLVQTIIPGFTHHPVARIEVSMLERVEVGVAY
jgi:hypothetical protein